MIEAGGRPTSGQGVSTDIIEAAARAYVRALSTAERRARLEERSASEPELQPTP